MPLVSYAPIGGGLAILCQLVASAAAIAIILGLMLTSSARARHVKYWLALGCVFLPIPLAIVLINLDVSSQAFGPIWFLAMGILLAGFLVIAAWPIREEPDP